MPVLEQSLKHFLQFEDFRQKKSFIHRQSPQSKILTGLFFIIIVLSFGKYEVSRLLPFFIFPVTLCILAEIPGSFILKNLLIVSPFVILIGIANPIFDTAPLFVFGKLNISGGWISYAAIILKFILTVSTALLLLAGTGMNAIARGLGKLGLPAVFRNQLMFLYRYITILLEEALHVQRARSVRNFSQKGLTLKDSGPVIGSLFFRSVRRSEHIFRAMKSRGFTGDIIPLEAGSFTYRDVLFIVFWAGLFILLKFIDIPALFGTMIGSLL